MQKSIDQNKIRTTGGLHPVRTAFAVACPFNFTDRRLKMGTRTGNKLTRLSGVYQIENDIDDRVYIGSSKDMYHRISNHLSTLKYNYNKNPLLQEFYNKFGLGHLKIKILEYCKPENLKVREQFYLDSAKEKFNICQFAKDNTGVHPSPEMLKRRSDRLKGIPATPEMAERLRNLNNDKKIPIIQYDKKMNFIARYEGLCEAARKTKTYYSSISKVCKKIKNHKTAGGFIWRFANAT